MSITTAWNANKRLDALNAVVNTGHTLKMALIKPSASGTYDSTYATYVSGMGGDEVSAGGGYSTGGFTLTVTNSLVTGVAQSSHSDVTVSNATISYDGAVIYDSSDSNKVIAVLSNGGTKTAAGVDLTIKSPTGGFVSI